MAVRDREHPGLLVQRGGEHVGGGERQRGPCDQGVDALVGQRPDVAAAQVPGGDLCGRMPTAQFPYGGSDHQVFDVADGDAFGLGLFTHGQLGLAGGPQQGLGPGEEALAGRREPGALGCAVQQPCAEMPLEPLDLAAQRRLGHVQVGGGPAEVLVRRHHGEVAHQPQFQVLSEIVHPSSVRVMPFRNDRVAEPVLDGRAVLGLD